MGSEMCIRDRTEAVLIAVAQEKAELDPQILVQAFNEINGAASEKTNVFD